MKRFEKPILVTRPYLSDLGEFKTSVDEIWRNQWLTNNGPMLKKFRVKLSEYPKRSYYCNLFLQYDCFEKTGEMHFTPPVQTVYATIQALKEYWAEGERAKWARHTRVFEALHAGLSELGFRNLIKREYQSGLVISVFYPDDPNWSFEKIHDYCYARGFTIYPGKVGSAKTFRLCALGAIDVPDIVEFFKVLKDALTANNIKVTYNG